MMKGKVMKTSKCIARRRAELTMAVVALITGVMAIVTNTAVYVPTVLVLLLSVGIVAGMRTKRATAAS